MRYKQTITLESDHSDRLQKVSERVARKAEEEGVSVEMGAQEGREIPEDSRASRTFDEGAMAV